ncbi:hypothetical protein AB0C28_51400 [Nonomuraea sp. NPDC048892]|uniref:hypothetical protein n=1 Tax=Nonomuraea sp. NPDC048892 TaxID=3154624 RepID=UPI0033D890D9
MSGSKILVAFGSRPGSTAGIAGMIAERFVSEVLEAESRPADQQHVPCRRARWRVVQRPLAPGGPQARAGAARQAGLVVQQRAGKIAAELR